MFTTQLFTIVLAIQPAATDPPEPEPFAPVRAEIMAVEQGMEIIAYDDQGELVGVLRATPEGERIRIEADFDDGYATVRLSPDDLDGGTVLTDLGETIAVGRVSQMFGFALPPQGETAISRSECMWIFAGLAAACGGGALFPPAGAPLVATCLFGLGGALCKCNEYLPINICP
jgi:hypothetical protein